MSTSNKPIRPHRHQPLSFIVTVPTYVAKSELAAQNWLESKLNTRQTPILDIACVGRCTAADIRDDLAELDMRREGWCYED